MRTGNYGPCEAGQRAHQRIITPQASTSAQTLSRQTETHNINNTKLKGQKHTIGQRAHRHIITPQASISAQTMSRTAQSQKQNKKTQIHDWSIALADTASFKKMNISFE